MTSDDQQTVAAIRSRTWSASIPVAMVACIVSGLGTWFAKPTQPADLSEVNRKLEAMSVQISVLTETYQQGRSADLNRDLVQDLGIASVKEEQAALARRVALAGH